MTTAAPSASPLTNEQEALLLDYSTFGGIFGAPIAQFKPTVQPAFVTALAFRAISQMSQTPDGKTSYVDAHIPNQGEGANGGQYLAQFTPTAGYVLLAPKNVNPAAPDPIPMIATADVAVVQANCGKDGGYAVIAPVTALPDSGSGSGGSSSSSSSTTTTSQANWPLRIGVGVALTFGGYKLYEHLKKK